MKLSFHHVYPVKDAWILSYSINISDTRACYENTWRAENAGAKNPEAFCVSLGN